MIAVVDNDPTRRIKHLTARRHEDSTELRKTTRLLLILGTPLLRVLTRL